MPGRERWGCGLGRRIAYVVAALIAIAAVVVMAAFLVLDRFDFAPLAASRATAALGRRVTVAGLHVTPGRWLTIELRGVRVDNIPGGTRTAMAELVHLTAEVEAVSLLHRPVNIRRLEIDGLTVLLERVADGTPNWRYGKASPPPARAEDRSWFPMLQDVRVHASEITVRTSHGTELRTRLENAAIRTDGLDAPVQLTVTGAYRDTPVSLDADLHSIAVLRDAAIPYGTKLRLTSGATTLQFDGTMTRPLDADGANGTLTLHAPTLAPVLAMAGANGEIKASLDLAGTLTRSGDLWLVTGATGRVDDSVVAASTLRLTDGGRGQPDSVMLDLAFDRLNLDPLLPRSSDKDAGTRFVVDRTPDPLLSARLTARQLSYRRGEATDGKLSVAINPAQIKVEELAMTVFGARLQASGQADSADKGGRFSVEAAVSGVDVQQLRRGIGAGAVPVLGRLDAQLTAESAGETLEAAVRSAHVGAVVGMTAGSISRDVIEKASTDIRQLFRAPKGMTPVSCLLGVIDMRAGLGTVSPLRIRTNKGTIAGQGRFDLYHGQIDVTIGSQSATTSDFALDIPVRISGDVSNPDVRPSRGNAVLAAADLSKLPPALQQAARRNPCIAAR
jgi:AsmA family protein